MIKSTLTSKAQTTIPKPVRAALHVQAGDELVYEIVEGGRVVLTKLAADPGEDPFAAFGEWDSPADRRAYADL